MEIKKESTFPLGLKLTVESEEDRNRLFTALKSAESVTMVL